MLNYWIYVLLFAIFGGLTVGLIVVACADGNWLNKTILLLTVMVALGFGGGSMCWANHNEQIYNWNDGNCIYCGEEYRFAGASRNTISHYYYYTCHNCGYTIELNQLAE